MKPYEIGEKLQYYKLYTKALKLLKYIRVHSSVHAFDHSFLLSHHSIEGERMIMIKLSLFEDKIVSISVACGGAVYRLVC